ncbi:MAG: PDZ domain-containing protein [Oscillospiraceae bacterium]|nr:PDZ domain-containing protein [Oscillospiraceae bacterium]
MKRKALKTIALVLAVAMSLSLCAFAAEVDYGKKLDEALALYKDNGLYSNNDTDYVREALLEMFEEDAELFYKLVNKIYGRDDRYSKYMTPEKYEESYEQTNSMVGIGVVITTTDDGYLTVQSLMDGPAKAAGILPGDKIIEADGMDMTGYLPAEAGAFIRGKEGTNVKLKILRGEEMLELYVRRAKVATSDVTSAYISDKIGYIELSYFHGINTFIDFMEVYDDFEEKGVNTIILDLRNNPGGELNCLINIMDNVIPEKEVPYLMAWQTKPFLVKTFFSEGYGWEFNKFIILVNGQTASAAEIMAGAMQDLGYAVIVGEKTFGKGLGQRHIQTSDGDEAIITGLELKLPVRGSYDGIGIKPDYEVSMKLTPYKLPYLRELKKNTDASKIKTDNVRAIEERLKCLGYFYGEADDEWDKRTVHAINLFCRENNLPQIGSVCKWELIEQIDHATQNLKYKYVAEDKPLDKAIELAEKFAASDKKAVRTDSSKINFNGK